MWAGGVATFAASPARHSQSGSDGVKAKDDLAECEEGQAAWGVFLKFRRPAASAVFSPRLTRCEFGDSGA